MLNRVSKSNPHAPAAKNEPRPTSAIEISAKRLSFTSGDQRLLDDLTFTIPRSTKTVIMGPNGAGKSLLLRILHGLIAPSEGNVLWDGAPASPAIELMQAMVFQRPVLLRRSASKNISFVLRHLPRSEREERTRAILEDANLAQIADTPARLLSGGEQQRLAIARALARSPQVLFLDEPTSGLDPASVHKVERMIESVFEKGIKIILVTHDMGQARRLADDVMFMHCGRLFETGPAQDFFDNPRSAPAKAYLNGELYLDSEEP